jgi:hypothetical protein
VRTVKTASYGADSVFVAARVAGYRAPGSTHKDVQVEMLKATARQRLAAGQGELDLHLERTATLPYRTADASLTAQWLEGEIRSEPRYFSRPDAETAPLIPVLAACNRAGFLTGATSTPAAAGRGCPTPTPRRCSRQHPAAPPCISCATPR